MINPHQVQTGLTHERKVAIYLFRAPEMISLRVRLKRPVGHAFDKKLPLAFEKEFRDRANSGQYGRAHGGAKVGTRYCRVQ
jgi:hypothetical protein